MIRGYPAMHQNSVRFVDICGYLLEKQGNDAQLAPTATPVDKMNKNEKQAIPAQLFSLWASLPVMAQAVASFRA